jgi:hypothetical protein
MAIDPGEQDAAIMSTTPLLLSYDTQSIDPHEHNETNRVASYYDILLVPYMLSYSAFFPCLISPLIRLFEKALVPTWMSHYTLSIGDYHFDLYREGRLPFASTAFFRVVQGNDLRQMKNAFKEERRWTGMALKLGTTTLTPLEIFDIGQYMRCNELSVISDISAVADQDEIYKQNNTSASNCLLGVPREYSLLQANCQHFILELIRRISPQFDETGDTWVKIQRGSTCPRFYCHLFLSCIGLAVNLLLVLLPFHMSTLMAAIIYHFTFSMVILQDYTIHSHRAELFYNEQRYLNIASSDLNQNLAQYNTQTSERYYLAKLSLTTVWMAWPLSIGAYHWFLKLGPWAIGFVALAVITYCACICGPAYCILAFLKSRNRITRLRNEESLRRFEAAYLNLTRRWDQLDGDSICSVCSPDLYEENRTSFLNIIVSDVETAYHPFGRKDIDRAIPKWVSKHRSRQEAVFSFKWKAMLCIYGAVGITTLLLWLLYKHWSIEH